MASNPKSYDFKAGWVLNPDAAPDSVEAKAPYVDNGTGLIAADRYWDPAFMRREWESLWTKTWLMAGRVSDLREAGDYFKFNVGRESIIVVRSSNGAVRAFYNVCQHRGAQLITDNFGSTSQFRCPFHSWAWTVEGKLCTVTDRETYRPEVLRGSLNLGAVRCETWGGWVFVCMDDNAPPLQDYLDVLPRHLEAYQLDKMVIVKDVEVTWPVNWKTALDAFLESYHVHAVHSEILPFYDDYHQQWDIYGNGMSRMLMKFAAVSPRYPDQNTVNAVLSSMLSEVGIDPATVTGQAGQVRELIQKAKMKLEGRLSSGIKGYAPSQMTDDWAYNIFPNVTLNIHPEGALVQRFRPHPTDPEQFIYDVSVLVHPIHDPSVKLPGYMGVPEGTDCSGKTRPQRKYLTRGDGGVGYVLEQDSVLVPTVQAGMHSRGFKGGRLSEQEQRLRHYHVEIDRYLAGEKW